MAITGIVATSGDIDTQKNDKKLRDERHHGRRKNTVLNGTRPHDPMDLNKVRAKSRSNRERNTYQQWW